MFNKKSIAIGINFAELIENDCYYVDKTLYIKIFSRMTEG